MMATTKHAAPAWAFKLRIDRQRASFEAPNPLGLELDRPSQRMRGSCDL